MKGDLQSPAASSLTLDFELRALGSRGKGRAEIWDYPTDQSAALSPNDFRTGSIHLF